MGNRKILLSAENGPILAADETGLVLRLSDRVVADLARRLAALPGAQPHAEPNSVTAPTAAAIPLDPAILGDIDGWDVTRQGDWLSFSARLPGADGPRRYLRHASGTGVLAQTPGPVQGIFSIAGGRRFNAPSLSPDFPFHILGTAAFEDADEDPPLFDNLRHCGLDADLAAALLRRRHANFRALPLFACAACPRSHSVIASSENAEKVVNPPRTQVINSGASRVPPVWASATTSRSLRRATHRATWS